ncbi:hypothetical protein [Botryobacter ruber]|uniref:hypothetical protein n=1 Tax=Botryobacter ruber TaxID=2171629 RepID=UPI001F0C3C8B|nr:hypothetical protein [Botryobacter ruber]
MMLQRKHFFLVLLCFSLLASGGCQRKGLLCPKRSKSTSQVIGPNGASFEATKVPTNKKGLVKKKKFFGLL